jgi:hypothetical protein
MTGVAAERVGVRLAIFVTSSLFTVAVNVTVQTSSSRYGAVSAAFADATSVGAAFQAAGITSASGSNVLTFADSLTTTTAGMCGAHSVEAMYFSSPAGAARKLQVAGSCGGTSCVAASSAPYSNLSLYTASTPVQLFISFSQLYNTMGTAGTAYAVAYSMCLLMGDTYGATSACNFRYVATVYGGANAEVTQGTWTLTFYDSNNTAQFAAQARAILTENAATYVAYLVNGNIGNQATAISAGLGSGSITLSPPPPFFPPSPPPPPTPPPSPPAYLTQCSAMSSVTSLWSTAGPRVIANNIVTFSFVQSANCPATCGASCTQGCLVCSVRLPLTCQTRSDSLSRMLKWRWQAPPRLAHTSAWKRTTTMAQRPLPPIRPTPACPASPVPTPL